MITRTPQADNQSAPAPLQLTIRLDPSPQLLEILRMLLTNATLPPVAHSVQTSWTQTAPAERPEETLRRAPVDCSSEQPPEPATVEKPQEMRTFLHAYDSLIAASRATISKKQQATHRTAAKQMDEFCRKDRCTTPILLVHKLPADLLIQFARHCIESLSQSPATVGHRLTHLCMILKAAHKAGWIDAIPDRPKPSEVVAMQRADASAARPARRVAKSVAFEDAQRLLDACDVARYPEFPGVTPAEWWRVMICWHALWGPRTQDIYAYIDRHKTGLTWEDVFTHPECPDAELTQALPDLQSPNGWLYYPVGKDRRSECPYVLLPMTSWQLQFVERFRGIPDPMGQNRVFPVARHTDGFGREWSAIRDAAGVSETVYLSQGTGGVTAFRKTASKWWRRVTDSKQLAQYILHHSEVTTADVHYLDTMETVLPLLLRHLDEFPLKPF